MAEAWEADICTVREAWSHFLQNDFATAESLFRRGMGEATAAAAAVEVAAEPDAEEDDEAPSDDRVERRDTRGAFALQYALVGLLRGVSTLSDEQLPECKSRLWHADALASLDTDWVGKRVVRGVCTLCAGIVHCLQREPVRGVFHILRSWRWLRSLKTEALEYRGVGCEVVRSSALLGLGGFALVLSLLPPHLVRAAAYTTGFEVDRAAGLAMLRTCVREGGIYAPVAALGWLAFHIDSKTFLGEEQGEEELDECSALLRWAAGEYPSSLFFSLLEADCLACRRRLPEALLVIASASRLPCLDELRAMRAMLHYKQGAYHLAALQWAEAGACFKASHAVYFSAGRRSLAPSMAINAALCYTLAADEGAAGEMLAEVASYRELSKSNWVPADRNAFRAHAQWTERCGAGGTMPPERWALLQIAVRMAFLMRCTIWMTDADAERFAAMLATAAGDDDADSRAQAAMCSAQLHAHRGDIAAGMAQCELGLSLSSRLGAPSRDFGTVPMLHCLSAQLQASSGDLRRAEASLDACSAAVARGTQMQQLLTFKSGRLRRSLGLQLHDAYATLSLPAGRAAVFSITLARTADEATSTVEWDWALEARDIDFGVRWTAAAGEPVELHPTSRHAAAAGPVEGSFELPEGCESGLLELTLSNRFSYFRSKAVSYRIGTAAVKAEPMVE